jgi:hypothetical protein
MHTFPLRSVLHGYFGPVGPLSFIVPTIEVVETLSCSSTLLLRLSVLAQAVHYEARNPA